MNSHKRMFVRIIWKAFAHRFSRVLIASLAIAMGASILSGLGLVAVTVPNYIAKELRSFGANLVVLPQGSNVITRETVAAIDRQGGESLLGRAGYSYGNLLYGQQPVPVMVTKFADARSVRPYWSIDGKVPQGSEQILLGVNLAEKFRLHVGDLIGLKVAQLRENTGGDESEDANRAGKQLEISGLLRRPRGRPGGVKPGQLHRYGWGCRWLQFGGIFTERRYFPIERFSENHRKKGQRG